MFANSLLASDAYERAMKAYQNEQWQEAVNEFMLVEKEHPRYATAMRYVGYNIFGREFGQWDVAVEFCVEAWHAAPQDPKVLEDLGRAALKRQKQIELEIEE
ncbi:hypothetical protein [Cerasicoccus maritimus]|uniref:hypothetical protein n=1 Tax=Cerasicoccus maritimus TaxID=490089 RepID=UPI00285250B9|nr:hypothetical protein [Cerasicoccus maritimus]